MAMKVGLEMVVKVLPDTVVTASDQAYLHEVIPPMLKASYRLPNEIRRLRQDNATEVLAVEAAQKALQKGGLQPSDIDCIISNNFGGMFVWPMVGSYVHKKVGFPEEIPVFNLGNACASSVDGFEIAWSLILSGRYKRVMVVAASAWESRGGQARADLTDPMSAVFGDAAAAAIISSQNLKCEFLSYYCQTFGEVYDMCAAEVRGPANSQLTQAKQQPEVAVYMFGTPQFFTWWQRVGPHYGIDAVKGALRGTNLTVADIDMVIFHQPADILYDMWIEGAAKAGLHAEKWVHTWDKYGNMGNCVVPVNLAEFWEEGRLKKNSILALISIGAGGHAPAMLIRWLV